MLEEQPGRQAWMLFGSKSCIICLQYEAAHNVHTTLTRDSAKTASLVGLHRQGRYFLGRSEELLPCYPRRP